MRMRTKMNTLTALALLSFSSFCLADAALTSVYNRRTPTFSEEDLINIVQKERSANPAFPEKVENSDLSFRRRRCHYTVRETPPGGYSFHISINTFGRIVYYGFTHEFKKDQSCPQPEHSIEGIAEFLRLARLRYSDLPPKPEEMDTMMTKILCWYAYFEKSKTEGNVFFHTYTFDYDGELVSFRAKSDESLRRMGYLDY